MFLGALSTSADSNHQIKKVLVNGHEAIYGDNGWLFEFVPSVKGVGLTKIDLTAEIFLKDRSTKGFSVVYVEN